MSTANQVIAINETEAARLDSRQIGPASEVASAGSESVRAVRRRLPDERRAITHHFSIAGQEGYLTVGVYEDGSPGEIFVRMAKEGSTVSGLMDAFATVVSLALQHGVPLSVLCGKLSHTRFEPSGWSGNPKIGYAKSLMDYIFRWLELRFLKGEQGNLFGSSLVPAIPGQAVTSLVPGAVVSDSIEPSDGPVCTNCGSLVRRGDDRCFACGVRREPQ